MHICIYDLSHVHYEALYTHNHNLHYDIIALAPRAYLLLQKLFCLEEESHMQALTFGRETLYLSLCIHKFAILQYIYIYI